MIYSSLKAGNVKTYSDLLNGMTNIFHLWITFENKSEKVSEEVWGGGGWRPSSPFGKSCCIPPDLQNGVLKLLDFS
jgi:hypothetical protein